MTITNRYTRTEAERRFDFKNAREYEEYVANRIGVPNLTKFNGKDDLDIWVPGYFIEIKEKNNTYTEGWRVLEGVEERNLFILDELTVRKALQWFPNVFFVLRDKADKAEPRVFLAPIWEIISIDKARLNRGHTETHTKGKWIIDLSQFTRLADEADIPELATKLLMDKVWKESQCLGGEVTDIDSQRR